MPVIETTTSTLRRIASHDINFKGLAGAILWCSLAAFTLYLVGFATEGWLHLDIPAHLLQLSNDSMRTIHVGLWQSCYCGEELHHFVQEQAWFAACRAMIILGLVGITMTTLCAIFYMFVHKLSKDRVLLIMIAAAFTSVIFITIGVIVFGAKSKQSTTDSLASTTPSFSFILSIISAVFAIAVGTMSIIQNSRAKHRALEK